MIERLDRSDGSVIGIRGSGKLTEEDYDQLLPDLERIKAEQGELNVLCWFDGFSRIEAAAIWEDVKFYVGNVGAIRRCAVVKDQDWQGTLARLGGFFGVEIRVFNAQEEEEAREWLFQEVEAEAALTSEERDMRRARAVRQRLDRIEEDLSLYGEKGQDPHAEALFETTAEVVAGLKTAFKHFEEQYESAWQE